MLIRYLSKRIMKALIRMVLTAGGELQPNNCCSPNQCNCAEICAAFYVMAPDPVRNSYFDLCGALEGAGRVMSCHGCKSMTIVNNEQVCNY